MGTAVDAFARGLGCRKGADEMCLNDVVHEGAQGNEAVPARDPARHRLFTVEYATVELVRERAEVVEH